MTRRKRLRGKYLEYVPGENYVREQIMSARACEPNTFRTIATDHSRIVFCCPRGTTSVCRTPYTEPGKCWCETPEGVRVGSKTQAILRHVDYFKTQYPEYWDRLQKAPVRKGIKRIRIR